MSNKEKKHKQQRPINQNVLDSIGSPNAWTPETEDAWLEELRKITAREIYCRFPPMKKPGNVRKRGKDFGWGGIV